MGGRDRAEDRAVRNGEDRLAPVVVVAPDQLLRQPASVDHVGVGCRDKPSSNPSLETIAPIHCPQVRHNIMNGEDHGPVTKSALRAVETPVAVLLHKRDVWGEAAYRIACPSAGQEAARLALPAPYKDDFDARIEQSTLRALAALLRANLEAVITRDHEDVAMTGKLVRNRRCVVEIEVQDNEHLDPSTADRRSPPTASNHDALPETLRSNPSMRPFSPCTRRSQCFSIVAPCAPMSLP